MIDPRDGDRGVPGRDDVRYMAVALEAARRGWGRTAPNPMVGAVVVQAGETVGVGWHAEYGGPHAEVMALELAGARARGATMYVTLEPCTHFGMTPPCTAALIHAGIARVVIGARDPHPQARGGIEKLRRAGLEVVSGVLDEASRELNAPFFFAFGAQRPWVTLKLALSLDGAMADAQGRAKWITGKASRDHVHILRAGSDAVAVGIGTVLADDPLLTVRTMFGPTPLAARPPAMPPARVVFDRRTRLPLNSALVHTRGAAPVVVVAEAPDERRTQALEWNGVDVLKVDSLDDALAQLRTRGIRSMLVEGGATLAAALLERALVDRLVIFQAPVVLGAGALRPFDRLPATGVDAAIPLRVVEREALGNDLMTVYALRELPCSPD